MALRLTKPRDVEKASYYVWFLGALESRGLRGREFIAPVVDQLLRKEQHVEPTKVTLQVSDKGMKIVQHVPKKGGKGRTEPVKHFIPDHAITCALQEPAPDKDIVSCILLIFNPVTKCPVHVHSYRCDSPETAALLAGQLQTLAGRPDNRAHIEQIEARLLERGLLAGPPPADTEQEPQQRAESAPSSGGSGSASGAPPVATLFDSLAAELRTKIGSRDSGPLLLPPRDYDMEQTGRAGQKQAVQEDSSGIGSDDAPSPDHRDRDRERTSSDEEWEAAGHSTEDLLLHSSQWRRQGSGWRGGRRSAGGQSPDTDELLTSGHSSSRKPLSQRQRSPSTSPQDRFNHARLKFVQMEQEKEVTPPPIVAPKKPACLDTGVAASDQDGARGWRQSSFPDGGSKADGAPAAREPRVDKGWRLPQSATDDTRDNRNAKDNRDARNIRNNLDGRAEEPARRPGEAEAGWRRPRPSREDSAPAEPPPADSAEEELRRDARGRPHVADIFRRPAPDDRDRPHREHTRRPEVCPNDLPDGQEARQESRQESRQEMRQDFRQEVRADHRRHEQRHEERLRGPVRTGRHGEPAAATESAPFPTDSDPRPDEVHARVDRWVRSAAQATPFTRAMSFEDPSAAAGRGSRAAGRRSFDPEQEWEQEPEPEPVGKRQPTARHTPESSDSPLGDGPRPGRLAKSRSSDTGLEPEQAQWRRSSAQVAAELRQRSRAADEPISPVTRHRSGASQQSEQRGAERRGRYQELQGASRLPGLDRETARDPLLPPSEAASRHRPTVEIDYRQNLPRRRDRSRDVRERRPPPAREQRPRARYQDEPRYREDEQRYREDEPRYREDESRHRRGDQAPPSHGYGEKAYPKSGYDGRGRSRHGVTDPHGLTQYDYRAGVTAHPY